MHKKGCVLNIECISWRQFLKFSALRPNFQQFCWKKEYTFAKFARKTACFLPKNCNRNGVFSPKIATERVQFWRLCWHTRIQKLGKCSPPPGLHLWPFNHSISFLKAYPTLTCPIPLLASPLPNFFSVYLHWSQKWSKSSPASKRQEQVNYELEIKEMLLPG